MKDPIILHCDMNNYYASVECRNNPKLRDKYVAVCGREKDRHGIVLAKNEKAKALGVKTGETIWQAKQKCPMLVTVEPHFDEYIKVSKMAQAIYYRYTDLIEPFGMDECWLDVSGSTLLFGSGREIADSIRRDIKRELGLTISVGVSFTKVFAKLGSDMKKPDAVTEIPKNSFKEKIWGLKASELIGVGRATERNLARHGIYTIGELAAAEPKNLKNWLGINGVKLWEFANGRSHSHVAPYKYTAPIKSIGHGITCTSDLLNDTEVWRVIFALSRNVSHRLRKHGTAAQGITIGVKDSDLKTREYSTRTSKPIRNTSDIAHTGFSLYKKNYQNTLPVRAITVRAGYLTSDDTPSQIGIFDNINRDLKRDRIEASMEKICDTYGKGAVTYGTMLCNIKLPGENEINPVMPSGITGL